MRVDDALLTFCNDAYGNAVRRGASEVGIADLVSCIAGSSRWKREIELVGGSAARLCAAAEASRGPAAREGSSGAPRTSDDLKSLLARAEAIADRLGRAFATPGDFIHVLLLESDDLGTAAFVRTSLAEASPRRSEAHSQSDASESRVEVRGDGWSREGREAVRGVAHPAWRRGETPTVARPYSASRAPAEAERGEVRETDRRAPAAPDVANAATAVGLAALSERLVAQETHLTELRRLVGGLTEQVATLAGRSDRAVARDPAEAVRRIEAELAELAAFEIAHRREGAGLASRVEAHERHLTEFRRLIAAMSHEAETSAARIAQALDLGRAQATTLVRLEQIAGTRAAVGVASGHERDARSRRKASRLRLRQLRQRSLRFRLRQRRRDRLRLRFREDRQRSAWSRLPVPAPVIAPRATLPDALAQRAIATAMPVAFVAPVPRIAPVEATADLDEDIAEPIEEEDDLEPVGAFGERPKRFYLALDDEVERAPSIGPRTAERLTAAGIVTVRDLLACDPRDVASRVASRYVSVDRVTAWKSQARLVCTVPWLRGTHAQLLVGAGFDSLDSLIDAETASVCAGILRFAATREGQSVLRSGGAPSSERVAKWMEHVTLAEPERAKLAA